MSESIHAGYLPLWNPYINFGIPQYGDMSSGYWSPLTWLIACTVGYNAYTLTLELLFYILLSGIGMFILTGFWKLNTTARIIAGIAYMCSGYITGDLQHFNWISGAALLPWCYWIYLLLLNNFSVKNITGASLLFYLFVSSAHPGISISAFYLFGCYLLYHLLINKQNLLRGTQLKKIAAAHLSFTVIFLLLSAGMITAYTDILPQFVRSEKLSLADALLAPTTSQCWISALFPFAAVKNHGFFNTDIAVRNCYFSLTLLLFFLLSIFNKKTSLQKFLLIAGASFASLSMGGVFKTIAYKCIPLMGYIRLNGEFRIFALFCFILLATLELNKFIREKKHFSGAIKWIYYTAEIIVAAAICFGIYKAFHNKASFLYHLQDITLNPSIALKLKSLIDQLSFYDTLWIQGGIQLLVLWGIKFCLKSANWQLLKKIMAADMILACLLNIPFTGVGKASLAQVQAVLNKSPEGIPSPGLLPIAYNSTVSADEEGLTGNWSMYNKQIGAAKHVPYPIMLKNMMAYFNQDSITKKENFLHKPFVFATDTASSISLQSFAPQKIQLTVSVASNNKVVLQQNFYPHWYYVNGTNKNEVNKYGINFMSAPLQKGVNNITFSFEPVKVKWAMLLSLVVFIICLISLLWPGITPASPS